MDSKISIDYQERIIEAKRRRLKNVTAVYILLIMFSILFMGPFLFGTISSFKDNPTEWPPSITAEQLSLKNWIGTYNLAKMGSGNGFFGELESGAVVEFEASFRYPEGIEVKPITAEIPKHIAGSGSSALDIDQRFASQYIRIKEISELNRRKDGDDTIVNYQLIINNPSQYDFSKVPLNIQIPYKVKLEDATYTPNGSARLGMIQGWDNIISGVIPYMFHNYSKVFRDTYNPTTGQSLFLHWILNSFILSIGRVITTIIFASMAGYTLARLKFKGKKALFAIMLFSMMIPAQVTFISNYMVLRDGIFGLTRLFGIKSLLNTHTGFVIWGMVSGSSVFIMKQFFEGLPDSLEEAAKIDGATVFQTFWKIMLPLAKPAMGALTVLTFQGAWNDFFTALVVITAPQTKLPLTVGLLNLRESYRAGGMNWGPVLAGSIISAIPIIIFFLLFQQYFVEGISFGSVND